MNSPSVDKKKMAAAFERAMGKLTASIRMGKNSKEDFVTSLRRIYRKFDPDNNGLSLDEFLSALEKSSNTSESVIGIDSKAAEAIFKTLDPNGDGVVLYNEFVYAYFNRRKMKYGSPDEKKQFLEDQAELRDKRRKQAMAKLKKDKWLRERESTLPPFDAKRFEANLLFNPKYYDCGQGGQGVEVTVKRSFDPEIPQSLAQIKWSFGEQSVPVLVIEEGDVLTLLRKSVGRDRRWCVGEDIDGDVGIFPMWCIDHSKTFTRLHTHIENKHAQLQSYKKRNEEERKAKEMKELVLCTFRPTVSKVARQLGVRGSG